jgi:MoxR-like ATPase
MQPEIEKLEKEIKQQASAVDALRQEVRKILVGQQHLLESLLIAMISDGHILIEGVPGLAKTTAVKAMGQAMGLPFQRISFTPDLLPADIIGTMIYDPAQATFLPRKGPVFTNLLLADEINRAPAKVQSALLEAMQERQVTIGDTTYKLPTPFLVLATQNPIEQEGTYPLPEAQVDRFMLMCKVGYPTKSEEREIMHRFDGKKVEAIQPVMKPEQIAACREMVPKIYCDEKVTDYILDIVLATRKPSQYGIPIDHQISYGASPRAGIFLQMAARARAMLCGRAYVTPQDIKEIAPDVLRHRVILTYEAEAEECTSDTVIAHILGEIPVP